MIRSLNFKRNLTKYLAKSTTKKAFFVWSRTTKVPSKTVILIYIRFSSDIKFIGIFEDILHVRNKREIKLTKTAINQPKPRIRLEKDMSQAKFRGSKVLSENNCS